jgi:PhzF family phenazine biosynthesis protein
VKIRQYQVDAFANRVFEGNPAAVCPLDEWLDDEQLQRIAEENNLSETAFLIAAGDDFELRWFTPTREVDLCGHATLASAHVLFHHLGYSRATVHFHTRSGRLSVTRDGKLLSMDFPAIACAPCDAPGALVEGLGHRPVEVHCGSNYMAVLEDEETVRGIEPDQALLGRLDLHGVIITAPGTDADFVSRYFAPKFGIPEDPVTGSAHCQLAPWWAARLGRTRLHARQVSRRGGELICRVNGDRVILSGEAVSFLVGEITLP